MTPPCQRAVGAGSWAGEGRCPGCSARAEQHKTEAGSAHLGEQPLRVAVVLLLAATRACATLRQFLKLCLRTLRRRQRRASPQPTLRPTAGQPCRGSGQGACHWSLLQVRRRALLRLQEQRVPLQLARHQALGEPVGCIGGSGGGGLRQGRRGSGASQACVAAADAAYQLEPARRLETPAAERGAGRCSSARR